MKVTGLTRIYKKILITILCTIFIVASILYFLRRPSNDRDWAIDQAILPYAAIDEESVTVFNVRNFTYTSVKNYTPAYYDKTYILKDLVSVDYIVEPLNNIGAAHTFLSFGFKNGEHIAISVEIRKEKGESFSPLKGLLRSYELMYVIADEKDAIKLRTNFRKDDVYLYPVQVDAENMQALFIDMLTRANELRENPEFYNTITNTCTTNIAKHINNISPGKIPWDIRLLLPTNSDALAYEIGFIDNSIPLEELRKQHLINAKALLYGTSPNFSQLIRQ